MYILFNNIIEQKEEFIDLNYNQHYELQKHLIKIENIINNILLHNKNNSKNELRNKNTINIDKNINYEKQKNEIRFKPKIGENNDKIRFQKIFQNLKNKTKVNNISKSFNIQNNNIKRSKSHNKINVFRRKDIIKNKKNKN